MRFFREMRRLGAGFGFAIAASCFWGSASAAPADCMATSPDGTAKCTLPVISERKYNVCIANNLSTTESASAYCSGTVGPIKDDGSIVNFVNCVGKRLTQNPPVMKAINWFPDGTADASREWL